MRNVDKKVVDASNFLSKKDNCSIYNVINKIIFKALDNIAPNYIYIYALKLIWLETVIFITLEEEQKSLQLSSANTKFGLKTFACEAP